MIVAQCGSTTVTFHDGGHTMIRVTGTGPGENHDSDPSSEPDSPSQSLGRSRLPVQNHDHRIFETNTGVPLALKASNLNFLFSKFNVSDLSVQNLIIFNLAVAACLSSESSETPVQAIFKFKFKLPGPTGPGAGGSRMPATTAGVTQVTRTLQ